MTQIAVEPEASKTTVQASYVLPIRTGSLDGLAELTAYLQWLSRMVEVTVVDGSPPEIFEAHAKLWTGVRHVAPSPQFDCTNGKVAGVLTGLELAGHDRVVIADDDVRYDEEALRGVIARLDDADVVRPQNYFDRLPWHAAWDSARILINRALDGDWPGTLAVRRSVLGSTSCYDGDCLFENLELVRTVLAAGGSQAVARDVFVRRLPPTTRQFWSQRPRQAYDEFARPRRLAVQLALAPLLLYAALRRPALLGVVVLTSIAVAESGRRRDNGASVFPVACSLLAPAWVLERAICSWLAVLSRLRYGGIRYRGRVIRSAATPRSVLNERFRK